MDRTPQIQRLKAWLPSLAGIVIFLPALWYGFVWDDRFGIVQVAADLGTWHQVKTAWFGPYDQTVSMFRPILSTVVVTEFHLFRLNPLGYHLVNIVLHAVVCAMVYQLAKRITSNETVALFAGLLFAVHAIHMEAIAWISATAEPLADIFILAGLFSYFRYRERFEFRWLAITCAWLFSGLLIKETAVTLPFFILAAEFTVAERATRTRRALVTTFIALSATVFIYAAIRLRVFTSVAPPETHLPLSTILYTLPWVFTFYLKKLLAPLPASPFYEQNYVFGPNARFWVPLAVLIVVAAVGVIWSKRSTRPGVVRFCFWAMAIAIMPVLDLNVFQWKEIAHDRFVYLSSVFFCILVAQLLFGELRVGNEGSLRLVAVAAGAAVFVFFAAALSLQLPVWKNDVTFYYYAHRMAPSNPRPAWGLAETYLSEGDLIHAEKVLAELVVTTPAPKALEQLAELRMRLGDAAGAEAPLRQALQIAPERPQLHEELGECLRLQGKTAEAQIQFAMEDAIRAGH